MAASGRDEGTHGVSPARSATPAQGPSGPVFDLWSPPPGALNLDEALMGDDAALDRLAAVLPVLGPDLESGVPDPGVPAPRREGSPDPVAPERTRSGPSSRSEARVKARGRGRQGLSRIAILILLVVVYALSVAAVLAWDTWKSSGSVPAGRTGGGVVIDGPPPCPMYRSPRSADAQSAGACFFVG